MKTIIYILTLLSSLNLFAGLRFDTAILESNSIDSLNVYYSFETSDVSVIQLDNEYLIDASMILSIKNNLNEIVEIRWNHSTVFKESPEGRINFGVRKIKLEPGQYKLNLKLVDQGSSKELNRKKKIVIPNSRKEIEISDIVLAYNVVPKEAAKINWGNDFLINDLYVIPNPSEEFSGDSIFLSYYFQIHNQLISYDEQIIDLKILNSKKYPVKELGKFNSVKNVFGTTDISDLATGVYYISVIIKEKENERVLERDNSTRFYVVNNNVKPTLEAKFTESQEFEMSEYATMDQETVDREFAKLKYILTNFEKNQYKQLDFLKAKQRALFKYWKYRDTDTTTKINERKIEYDKAVQYADTYFHFSSQTEGWRTDRGRVLLTYGFPTDVDRFEEKEGKNACEIWYYGDIRGGVYFYFVDVNNYNNYILVHSTMINELYDDKWMERYNPAIDQTIYMELKNSLPDDERDF